MKIGIIVYSKTGNTLSVVKKLKEVLGNNTVIEQIEVEGEPRPGNVNLITLPKVNSYDKIVFAAPVQAFSLCLSMKAYLDQIGSLKDKKVALLVTEGFAYPWLGGNRAIRQMKHICEDKDATIIGTAIVNWGNKKREQMINDTVSKFKHLLN